MVSIHILFLEFRPSADLLTTITKRILKEKVKKSVNGHIAFPSLTFSSEIVINIVYLAFN